MQYRHDSPKAESCAPPVPQPQAPLPAASYPCKPSWMTTANLLDPRTALGHWATYMMGNYVSDIPAIPEDKWTSSMGGCTRPASEMTAEVVSILDWATTALRGQPRTGNERELIAEYAGRCSTKDAAAAEIQRAVSEFVDALAKADDDKLTATVTAPWGAEMPLIMIAHVVSSHLWYHDPQLNYIQCLPGDDKYHW